MEQEIHDEIDDPILRFAVNLVRTSNLLFWQTLDNHKPLPTTYEEFESRRMDHARKFWSLAGVFRSDLFSDEAIDRLLGLCQALSSDAIEQGRKRELVRRSMDG